MMPAAFCSIPMMPAAFRLSARLLQRPLSLLVCGLLLAPAVGRTDSTDTGQIVLQMKFRPGEVSKYQTSMQIAISLPTPATASKSGHPPEPVNGSTFNVHATQDIRVRRVLPDGGGELEVTTTGQNSLPGQPPVLSNDPRPVAMTYDKQGKLVSIKRQSDTAASNPMMGAMLGSGLLSMQGLVLPSKPVRPGETWTQRMPIPGITGKGSSTIKTTLVRIENVGRYRTARLHVMITTPVSAYLDAALQPTTRSSDAASTMTGTATVNGDINFAIAEGTVIRSVSNGVTNMTVTVGKPSLPPTPAKKKKGAAGAAPAAAASSPQNLRMTVKTSVDTKLVEEVKK